MSKYEIIPLNGGDVEPKLVDGICPDIICPDFGCGSNDGCFCENKDCPDYGCNCGIWSRTLPPVE